MAAFSTFALDPLKTYHVLLKDGSKSSVTGATSASFVDGDYYDGSTYSQIIGADVLGNSHWVPIAKKAAENGYGYVGAANGEVTPLFGGETVEECVDEAFVLTATPGKTLKSCTMMLFWSGASGTGNVLLFVPFHLMRIGAPTEPDLID
jgi:hypothetical protein